MKQSTYQQKLNEAMDDHRKLSEAAQLLVAANLRTFEAKQVWRELTDAIAKLDKAIERYRRMAGVEAKHAELPAADWLDAQTATDATINSELAAQGLRRASQLDGEPGWYVMTSEGQAWATDTPEGGQS